MKMKNSVGQLMIDVNDEVFMERMRQNEKWGWQRHESGKWLSIAVEEVGEVCQALNRINFPSQAKETDKDNLYEELIQASAVFSAWAEQIKEEMEK